MGRGLGAYAEQVAVPVSSLLPLPEELSYEQGAAFYVAYPTSYEALVGRANAKKGETVLVHAAAGGVGVAAVQIAKSESPFPPTDQLTVVHMTTHRSGHARPTNSIRLGAVVHS